MAEDIPHVLGKANPRKALGADHWHLHELKALPTVFLQGLANFYTRAEQPGAWPRPLATIIVALIPKEGAKTDADLRLGLTPTYRLWMCIRK